jgi:hypothetical protein
MPAIPPLLSHEALWEACKQLPEDYYPYGENLDREGTPEEHAATAGMTFEQLTAY